MSEISAWILSICGVVLLGALIDILIPDGKMRKFTKSVFAVIVLFVILRPLPALIDSGFGFKIDGGGINIDDGIAEITYKQKIGLLESDLKRTLDMSGYSGVKVTITVDKYYEDMRILSVACDLTELTLSGSASENKRYEDIARIASQKLSIAKESVVFYG
ncbi:MAG: stage III sporulation protein AF [Clostridiales bacterium]|jgi:stage III sporulation protein AF|nr:stage III sporulation protein AF [Clostridiales bacterium]